MNEIQKGYTIRPMLAEHWSQVRTIYQKGIDGRMATFETQAPAEWETWSAGKRPDCRLVACTAEGTVLGWVAISPTSKRAVYAGVCELSVYVDPAASGQGVGSALMRQLIAESEAAGVWMLQGTLFPENEGSFALHKKMGFRVIGRRERVARLDGVWRDTVLVERRSEVVGID